MKSTISGKKVSRLLARHGALDADTANGVSPIPMDHPSHGVTATIIDLGLARMDANDSNSSGVHWTPFDDLIFEGEGEIELLNNNKSVIEALILQVIISSTCIE